MGYEVQGLFGLIALIISVYVILQIALSASTTTNKALWIVLVLVLPMLGAVIWYFAGPRKA
ncbi:MAG: PLD nuclease N-terminal domain-containing protein [Pseudomonadota bacterium]